MRRRNRGAALDGGRKASGDAAFTHMADQRIDRRLPIGCVHFLRDTVVGQNSGVPLRQRHEVKRTQGAKTTTQSTLTIETGFRMEEA